ncbi:hypothetical protein UlMin_040702 [Ulmus minor]
MKRRFRQAITALKERSSVNYAKIATVGGFCSVDFIIIKATSPDDLPLPEKYIHRLLKIFSISQTSYKDFSLSFTRRFGKTRSWRVALKCLLLLHRLLRSVPETSPFRADLLWNRTNGLISLYPCRFRDDSSSASVDYTAFIRSYAHLLDEVLSCYCLESKAPINGEEEQQQLLINGSLSEKMRDVARMLEVLPQLQSLIDRVMDCRPVGSAATSFIVKSAMKHIIRDSFICYTTFRKEIVLVLDNLFQMPFSSCTSAFEIYKKSATQANLLGDFYDRCKAMGFCGSYEYPIIERIPFLQIDALETFLNGMWQFTESSSSPSLSSSEASPSSTTAVAAEICPLNKFNLGEEEKPLIQFDIEDQDYNDESWETLLEASVNLSPIHQNYFFDGNYMVNNENVNENKMQIFDPNIAPNPFYQQYFSFNQFTQQRGVYNNSCPTLL